MNRRSFLSKSAETTGARAATDLFCHFLSGGHDSLSPNLLGAVNDHVHEAADPSVLIYSFMKGTWMSWLFRKTCGRGRPAQIS